MLDANTLVSWSDNSVILIDISNDQSSVIVAICRFVANSAYCLYIWLENLCASYKRNTNFIKKQSRNGLLPAAVFGANKESL